MSILNDLYKKRQPGRSVPLGDVLGQTMSGMLGLDYEPRPEQQFGGMMNIGVPVPEAPQEAAPAPAETMAPAEPDTFQEDVASLTDEQRWKLLHMPQDVQRQMVAAMLAGGNPKSWQYGGGF